MLGVIALLSPALYSYATTMLQPSSLPIGVRSVEWLRANHGNWLVDEVEHYYYSWNAPTKGGPQLTSLPVVGLGGLAAPAKRTKTRRRAVPWPPSIKPVFPHPLPGEGIWKRTVGSSTEALPCSSRPSAPNGDYPRIVAYLAWFDHSRTALAFYPGRYEPPNAPVRGPMSVPNDQRWRLLATFNSGFVYSDGQNGSSINGLSYEPLKDGLATLIGYRNGRVDIETWHGGPNTGPGIAFARQSLPLIIDDGRLSPALNDSTEWGFTLGNAVRVWRTGVGVDRRGNLIYAAADDQTVITLARILQRAGAVRAMQFDINPEWPSLISYGHSRASTRRRSSRT